MGCMILKDKYVLHIPCCKWDNGKYEPVDAAAVVDILGRKLSEYGIDSMYYDKTMGRYKGREYEQLLVTVFCNEVDVGKIFLEICRESDLQQEAYAYEYNGKLYVCELK